MKLIYSRPYKTILKAVNLYVDFLSETYGPAGKKILIVQNEFNHQAVDDGHIASKNFELENEAENAVIQYVKETTEKTNNRVGDGTTTSAIIMGAIVKEVFKDLDNPLVDLNTHKVSLELQKGLNEAVKKIKESTKKIKTKEELYSIAFNSFNDSKIATLISETLFKIGQDGAMTVEDSQGMETTCEILNGLEIDKGFTSPYLINTDKQKVYLENPRIIITNKRLESFNEIAPVIKNILDEGKREIMIIADGFSEEVITNTLILKIKGAFNPLLVESPGYGEAKQDLLNDIAVVVGGKVIDFKNGDKFETLTPDYLGTATSVSSQKDKTVFIGGKGTKSDIQAYVNLLKKQLETESKYNKEIISKRIAGLLGGIAVIKVGAHTDNEQKSIKAKVEDAMNATKIAFKDGVTEGAGLTYSSIKTSSEVLNTALKAPRIQLEKNKEFLSKNVVDPSGVLIAALETAVSIACGLITLGGIITNKRKKEEKNDLDY